jgi:multidrug efflux pump subunit AcrA (membrane-fusion protein)
MLVRSILASYSKLLAGLSLAILAIALTGCNDKVAEKVAPSRPVLVATVHYEAESPERSFVGTIKPRIETDMGFRVPGKS